ncbi:MAG TPA: pyridoxamine 5'-phosphate oxidase family protein [Candidatus Saccharimonas sp.]|nr:pyridoxamine 5'-phosphate oxidase family protein [Candidatus Saccharimonas sp.]
MDNTQQLIHDHLQNTEVMQLATVRDGKPWCSTVHFYADDALNVYWCSALETRHSKELQDDNSAAIAVAVQIPWPVIGVQMEGTAGLVKDADEIAKVMSAYAEKLHRDSEWAARVVRGEDEKKLYCFTPQLAVLFDPGNKENARREWRP